MVAVEVPPIPLGIAALSAPTGTLPSLCWGEARPPFPQFVRSNESETAVQVADCILRKIIRNVLPPRATCAPRPCEPVLLMSWYWIRFRRACARGIFQPPRCGGAQFDCYSFPYAHQTQSVGASDYAGFELLT